MREDILNKLSQKISELFLDQTIKINPENTFSQIGLDSLDVVGLTLVMEYEFKINLPNSILKIKSISKFVDVIENVISENNK